MQRVILDVPNFAGGLVEGVEPSLLEPNQLAVCENFLPAKGSDGALEQVAARYMNILSGNDATSPANSPVLQNVKEVYYYHNNLHGTESAPAWAVDRTNYGLGTDQPSGVARTPYVEGPLYGGNKIFRFGFRTNKAIHGGNALGSVICVELMAKQVGATDAAKHAVTAALYDEAGNVLAGWTLTSVTYPSGTDYHMTLLFTGTTQLEPANYMVEITAAAADAGQHWAFWYWLTTATVGPYFGWCHLDATTVEFGHPAALRVYSRIGTTDYTAVANRANEFDITIYPSNATGAGSSRDGVPSKLWAFTNGIGLFSVYRKGLEPSTAMTTHRHNCTQFIGQKIIGSINAWAKYDNKLVLGGVGGIAIMSFDNFTFYTAGGFVNIPNIENRINTTRAGFIAVAAADVFPPEVSAIWVGGINPGRIFAAIGDTIIWSGGTTAATAGDLTSWSALATIQFGDTTEKITHGCWFQGRHLIFTESGALYALSGEVPIDPSTGYGTLRAEYVRNVGKVTHLEPADDAVYFATEPHKKWVATTYQPVETEYGSQVWRMDGSMVPQRIDEGYIKSLAVSDICWDRDSQQLWVRNVRHVVHATTPDDGGYRYYYDDRSVEIAVSSGGTPELFSAPTFQFNSGCAYVYDRGKWYCVLGSNTRPEDSAAMSASDFVYGRGPMAFAIQDAYVSSTHTYTARLEFYAPTDFIPRYVSPPALYGSEMNTAETAVHATTYGKIITKLFNYDQFEGVAAGATGQLSEVSVVGSPDWGTTNTHTIAAVTEADSVITVTSGYPGVSVFVPRRTYTTIHSGFMSDANATWLKMTKTFNTRAPANPRSSGVQLAFTTGAIVGSVKVNSLKATARVTGKKGYT